MTEEDRHIEIRRIMKGRVQRAIDLLKSVHEYRDCFTDGEYGWIENPRRDLEYATKFPEWKKESVFSHLDRVEI